MDKKHTWAIEDIFKNVTDFEEEYEKTEKSLDFSVFKGKLGQKSYFYAFMKKQEKVSRSIEKMSVYAMMLHDGDTRNSFYDGLVSKTTTLCVKFETETAFFLPELNSLCDEVLEGYLSDAELTEYDYFLKTALKQKKHILSENEERLLALGGDALSTFREIFTKIDNADLPLKPFVYNGKKISVTHGNYGVAMHSNDREFRKKYFKKYYSAYVSLINVISSTYAGSVKKDVFSAKARNYSSSLEKALSGEDVPESVYRNLLNTTNQALYLLHDYMYEKKKALSLEQMHMYDIYAPTVENAELKLDYEKAYDLVIEGLSCLGKEYASILENARKERWISVYESAGKRSGAYSVATYDTHPYVLLNYHPTTSDVFTIAHEMGHSVHSYFSNANQPYLKADYKIFVAEVASTVNEVLLARYLLKTAKDEKLKKYLLSYLLEMIRTTLFRQTQFAEFEEYSHSAVEKGEPLTKDGMCKKYFEINKKYYGDAITYDDEIKYEWARIPHFYRAFYVYKYATGIISALAIAERILTEGEKSVKDYFKFLSSGNSDSPVELLKIAGVDLTEEKPFKSAFKVFADTLEEFKILNAKEKF